MSSLPWKFTQRGTFTIASAKSFSTLRYFPYRSAKRSEKGDFPSVLGEKRDPRLQSLVRSPLRTTDHVDAKYVAKDIDSVCLYEWEMERWLTDGITHQLKERVEKLMKEAEIYKEDVSRLNSGEHIDVGQEKSQEKYKSWIEAQLEKVSTETEMKLLQLTLDQLSLDLESVNLSAAEKRENELKKQDVESKMTLIQEKLAHLQSATDVLTPPTTDHDQLCETDEHTMALATDAINRFHTAVKNYAAYTQLIQFSETTVLTRGVTQLEHLRNAKECWAYLKSEQRPKLEATSDPSLLRVIRLPDDIFWPLGDDMHSTLFVRTSQEQLYNEVYHKYLEQILTSEKLEDVGGHVIVGTAGIGKSASLNFLLYLASELDVDVVIQRNQSFAYVLHRDGDVTSYDPRDTHNIPELFSQKNLYLYTHGDDEKHVSLNHRAFAVIASTPVRNRYKGYFKFKYPFDIGHTWTFGWSLEEAIVARQALQPAVPLSDEDIAQIKQRYYEVGGSCGLLMLDEVEYQKMLSARKKRFEQLTLADLEYQVELIKEEEYAPLERSPFAVFHCYPAKVDKTEKHPRTYAIGFASAETQHLIENALDLDTTEKRKSYQEFKSEELNGVSPAVIGNYYELNFHNYMRKYTSQAKLRVFNDKHKLDTRLSKVPKYVESEDVKEDIVKALLESHCAYIVPSDPRDSLVDAFYVLGKTVYCLFITINGKHAVKAAELQSLTNTIETMYNEMRGTENALTFKYVGVSDVDKEELNLEPDTFYIRWRNAPM